MRASAAITFGIDAPPQPVGVVPAFPISTAHPDWPSYTRTVNSAVAGTYTGYNVRHVIPWWVADGSRNASVKTWCVSKFRSALASSLAKWNSNQELTEFSGDQYLYACETIENWCLVLSYFYDVLTAQEISDASMILEQCLKNMRLDPQQAKWGAKLYPWSGWGQNGAGNNYFYAHLLSVVLWALTSRNQFWSDHLRVNMFPLLQSYFATMLNGFSREGTYYSTSHAHLFKSIWTWRTATGEDHSVDVKAAETIEVWARLVSPDFVSYVPIGDQPLQSYPTISGVLGDYIRSVVVAGLLLVPRSPKSDIARWLLTKIGRRASSPTNYWLLCINSSGTEAAPSGGLFVVQPQGYVFASAPDNSFVSFIAGLSDQSHDGFEQSAFQLYVGGAWRLAGAVIWSHSGLDQTQGRQNCIVFRKADGTIIPQAKTPNNSLMYTDDGNLLSVRADVSDCYKGTAVTMCRRDFNFDRSARKITTHDTFTLSSGTGEWSVNYGDKWSDSAPPAPAINADGSIAAGPLTIRCLTAGAVPSIVDRKATLPAAFDRPCWCLTFGGCTSYLVEVTW